VEEILAAEGLAVYPNPAQARVHVRINTAQFHFLNYQLLDINARIVQSGSVEQSEFIIDLLPAIESGTYLLRFNSDSNFKDVPLLISR
jgi:hypothetical protein